MILPNQTIPTNPERTSASPSVTTFDVMGNRTVADLLDAQATRRPNHEFIVFEDTEGMITRLTFAETRSRSLRIAAGFQALGVRKGDRVFLHLRNTPDYVPIWMAMSYIGAVLVPGNIYLTQPEVTYLVNHSRPAVIITESRLSAIFEGMNLPSATKRILLTDAADDGAEKTGLETLLSHGDEPQPVEVTSEDLAEILYTSGTSSRPKGVMHTHANLVWCGISMATTDLIRDDDRIFNNKPLFHANCQATVLISLVSGATAVIGERYSASRYMKQLIRHDATICNLSGMLCRTLLNQPTDPSDTGHRIRFGFYAINISQSEFDAFIARFGIPLRNGYGMSEAMISVTAQSAYFHSGYPSIGRPNVGRQVRIVGEDGRIMSSGEVGEIEVHGVPGRTIMLGYFDDPDATRATMQDGWLKTGDLGYSDDTGQLFYFGRKKDVIKRSGENISATEVEEVLVNHPDVIDAAVVGVPDPVRDQSVKAFLVLADGATPEFDALRAFCAARLAYFKVPETFAILGELPRNASGKVLKRELMSL